MRNRTKQSVLVLLVGLAAILAPILFRVWKASAERGGQQPAELFRIAGNFYPEQGADLERSFRVLRTLPADIWVTNRARPWGR